MQNSLRALYKFARLPTSLNYISGNVIKNGARTVCSQASLGIDRYLTSKDMAVTQMGRHRDKFFSQVKELYIDNEDDQKIIFVNDIFTLLNLAESDEEIDIAVSVVKQHYTGTTEGRMAQQKPFVFGPIIMRLFHIYNKHEMAYSLFTDKSVDGLFDQLSSCTVLMDLLFENKEFEKVLEVYNRMKQLVQSFEMDGPPRSAQLVMALTCLAQNTPESYNLWLQESEKEENLNDNIFPGRSKLVGSLLAIKQNHPEVALQVLGYNNMEDTGIPPLARNILIKANACLGQMEEVLTHLRQLEYVFPDVINDVEEALKTCKDEDLVERIRHSLLDMVFAQDKSLQVALTKTRRQRSNLPEKSRIGIARRILRQEDS